MTEDQEPISQSAYTTNSRTRLLLIGVIVVLAFGVAYGFASQRAGNPQIAIAESRGTGNGAQGAAVDRSGGSSGSAACGDAEGGSCCGGSTETIEGATVLDAGVQRIAVDVSQGSFNPNAITAKSGVPIEIVFGQGSGCLAEVQFPQFGVLEDLTNGGATVTLPALEPGTYGFSCGMEMVFGTLVVQ